MFLQVRDSRFSILLRTFAELASNREPMMGQIFHSSSIQSFNCKVSPYQSVFRDGLLVEYSFQRDDTPQNSPNLEDYSILSCYLVRGVAWQNRYTLKKRLAAKNLELPETLILASLDFSSSKQKLKNISTLSQAQKSGQLQHFIFLLSLFR